MIRKLATVYDPDIPFDQNEEYIKLAKEVREETEAILQGNDRDYSSRSDRGWVPPSKQDVKAVIDEAKS